MRSHRLGRYKSSKILERKEALSDLEEAENASFGERPIVFREVNFGCVHINFEASQGVKRMETLNYIFASFGINPKAEH